MVGLGVGVGVGCCDLKTCNDIAGRRPMTTKKGAGGEMGTDFGASKALWQSGSGVGLLSRWALLAWVRSLKVSLLHCMLGQMCLPRVTSIEPRTFTAIPVPSKL